jgi:tetratricopeptide (TPR) repeat protein
MLSMVIAGQDQSASFDDLSKRAAAALQNDPETAIKLYREALGIRADWAEGWFYLAAALYERNQFSESAKAFARAAALAPDNGTVWAFLGLSEYQMEAYATALSHIRKGEALGLGDDKGFISSVRNCGALICLRSGEYGQAVEQLQPLATIGDDSTRTLRAFGIAALGLRRLPADLSPQEQPMVELAGRAAWAMAAERAEDAKAAFEQLLARYPQAAGVHHLYGIYVLAHDPAGAAAQFKKEIAIRPAYVPARIQLANLELRAGRDQSAEQLAREAVKLQPQNAYAHVMLGRALLSMGRLEPSINELQTAAKLIPQNSQPHFYLEQAYRKLGKTAEAEKERSEFARLKAAQDPLFRPEYGGTPEAAASGSVQ